jgi:hypothetical protein
METIFYLNAIYEQNEKIDNTQFLPPPPQPEEVQTQINVANTDNIQKYILFNKILNLKYQLENSNVQKLDAQSYNDAVYFLNILISFFDTFSLDDLTSKIDMVLNVISQSIIEDEPNAKQTNTANA